jgi:hypothetical protein
MKKISIYALLMITMIVASCGFLESKERSMNNEKHWAEIVTVTKEILKDKKDITLLSFRAKDKMSTMIEKINIDYLDGKNTMSMNYNFIEKKWDEPVKIKSANKQILNINELNLEGIHNVLVESSKKIKANEKIDSTKTLNLNYVTIVGNQYRLYLQMGIGNSEYVEYLVNTNKKGTFNYSAN